MTETHKSYITCPHLHSAVTYINSLVYPMNKKDLAFHTGTFLEKKNGSNCKVLVSMMMMIDDDDVMDDGWRMIDGRMDGGWTMMMDGWMMDRWWMIDDDDDAWSLGGQRRTRKVTSANYQMKEETWKTVRPESDRAGHQIPVTLPGTRRGQAGELASLINIKDWNKDVDNKVGGSLASCPGSPGQQPAARQLLLIFVLTLRSRIKPQKLGGQWTVVIKPTHLINADAGRLSSIDEKHSAI